MRSVLLCTVGTSLRGNLERDKKPLFEFYQEGRWSQVAKGLLDLDANHRDCGAEINSVEEMKLRKQLALQNIVFLVSDTSDGKAIGEVLRLYFEQRTDLNLSSVETKVIQGLQDENPKEFKTHGLRNLVRSIGECVSRFGGSENVVIDATGGYKAQIAVAVLMGQALDIPVFYKHERFSEIIDFPPLPISFDYEVLARNATLLTDFERGEALSLSEIGNVDEKLRALLIEVPVDDETLYELSPIGQVYLTGFRYRNPKPINLKSASSRTPPSFRDDHYPKGFREFVEKVCSEHFWIVTANSLPYYGQRAIKGIGFDVREDEDGYKLIGTYQDKDNFGARYRLHLTDESLRALTWAADQLNQKYRS